MTTKEQNDLINSLVTEEIDKLILEDINLVARGLPTKNIGKTLIPFTYENTGVKND